MDADKYIKKWLEGTLSESEKAEFEKSNEYEFLNRLDNALKQFRAPEYQVDEELRHLNQLPKAKPAKMISWPTALLKIAAILILLSGLTFIFITNFSSSEDVQQLISYDDTYQSKIYLPDHSSVQLNTDSRISFNKKAWNDQRSISLVGEAFFSVEKGEKFSVTTAIGEVTVLGTEFNVKNRDEFFQVSCFEGKVAVSFDGKEFILDAGQQIQAFDNQVFQNEIKKGKGPSWINGISEFDSVPVKEVFAELERQFDISISYGDDTLNPDRLFTGAFSHTNLDSALKSITIPLNLTFKKSGNTITLTKN
ncbi:FecR family protein [Ekhidna sp.]|uniref:FecR family protein n=1 Tax=Ekhidna sp. TaxID=2608089 RepID=UPI003B5A40DD